MTASGEPDVLVDARMRKRATPEIQRSLAPLRVGLGPGFIAGEATDLVVETSWKVIEITHPRARRSRGAALM